MKTRTWNLLTLSSIKAYWLDQRFSRFGSKIDLKIMPTESSTEPVRMDKLSAESRKRKRKVKDNLREHPHSDWANKLKGDLSSYLSRG